ncbi:matrixin family metalloprotease [Paraburkholderia sp. Ac-20342]|uniref:matrixin family metalloprotease n=1 Tax=Paraburkholderia sp. Ac-20342 TaxID=2703889 RepID=UPI0019810A81|nr:matrixin family metalloprotease [Paraburkholderia sp. Ac-20342]MBN3851311.1 matrixin family metalloprotease [Paraburkholderia sp. Ac-20342]
MTSVIAPTVSGLGLMNQWLAALGAGENADAIAKPGDSALANSGSVLELGATAGNALGLMSDMLAGITGLGGGAAVFASDFEKAIAQYNENRSVSSEIAEALVGDVSGLVSAGLLTAISSAQAAGASSVVLGAGLGTLALPVAEAVAVATGAVAVVLAGVGLLSSDVTSSITASANVFSGLNLSDDSSDITLPTITVTASSQPDITTTSADGTVVTQTWEDSSDSYTLATTYTSSARTEISSEVTTEVDSQGQKTVTTVNYNPDGLECTFNQSVSSSTNPNDVVAEATGTETVSGTVQAVNLTGTGISTTVSDATINFANGASGSVTGQNDVINATGASINLAANSSASIEGTNDSVTAGPGDVIDLSNATITLTANSSVTINGSNDTIIGATGDTISINGTGEIVTASGDSLSLGSDTSATISGGDDSVMAATGSSATVDGDDNVISSVAGATSVLVGVSGIGDLVNLNANSSSIVDLNGGSGSTINAADDFISMSAGNTGENIVGGSNNIYVNGTGDTFSASNASVELGANTWSTVAGSNNSIVASGGNVQATLVGNGDQLDSTYGNNGFAVQGTGATFNVTSDGVVFDQGASGTVSGDANAVAAAGTGVSVALLGNGFSVTSAVAGDGFSVTGSSEIFNTTGDGITFEQGSGGDVHGDGNTVTAGGDDVGVALFGNGDTVNSAIANDGFAVTGGSEVFNTTGDGITFEQGSGGDVNGNSNAIATAGGDVGVALFGNGDTVDSAIANDGFAVTGGSEIFNTTGDGITFEQGSGGDVNGNDNAVAAAGSDVGVALFGNGDTVNSAIANDGFLVSGTGETFDTTDDGITFEDGSHGVVNGDDNYMGGSSDISVYSNGSDNSLNGQTLADGSEGDLSDSGVFSDPDESDPDPGGYYGYYGYYGLSGKQSVINAALGRNIGSIAQYDLSVGNQTGAVAAEKAFKQAQLMADATPTSGTGSAVDSGNKWAGDIITWSLGANMGSQYDEEVQQAFAAWAAASGLTFEEVSGSSKADIQIGFSDLDTATTAVAGYTTYRTGGGQILSAAIQLEDPGQDSLVAGAGGQLTYSGTGATLEQVLMHEIGHALGLADDSDQDSIMYYELTSNNPTLDSTDIAGIQSIYGSAGSPGAPGLSAAGSSSAGHAWTDHRLGQLIAGMASFNPQSAGNTSFTQDEHAHHHGTLAASAN